MPDLPQQPRGGYSYHLDIETIRRYKVLPPGEKLRWLEEATVFINKVAPERTKRLHRLFREGKL